MYTTTPSRRFRHVYTACVQQHPSMQPPLHTTHYTAQQPLGAGRRNMRGLTVLVGWAVWCCLRTALPSCSSCCCSGRRGRRRCGHRPLGREGALSLLLLPALTSCYRTLGRHGTSCHHRRHGRQELRVLSSPTSSTSSLCWRVTVATLSSSVQPRSTGQQQRAGQVVQRGR